MKNRDNITNTIKCKNPESEPQPTVELGIYRAERTLLRLLADDLSLVKKVKERLGSAFWRVSVHQQIFDYLDQESASPALADEAVQSQLASLLLEEFDTYQTERLFEDCLKGIRSAQAEESVEDLQARMVALEKSGDMAGAMALLKEIGERLKRGK